MKPNSEGILDPFPERRLLLAGSRNVAEKKRSLLRVLLEGFLGGLELAALLVYIAAAAFLVFMAFSIVLAGLGLTYTQGFAIL